MRKAFTFEGPAKNPDTLESVDQFFQELVELRNDYSGHWKRFSQEIGRLLIQNPDRLRFGPKYYLTTSQGERIMVSVLFYDTRCDDNGDDDERRDTLLIAQDESGKVLGDDYRKLRFNKRLNFTEVEGLMTVGEKSRGIGTLLHLALANLLQREANRRQSEVQWKIRDANIKTLRAIEKQGKGKSDPAFGRKLEAMREERQRWIALYGDNGKLGFGDGGRKIFQPNGQGEDIESIGDIVIERVDESGRAIGKETLKQAPQDMDELRRERLEELRDLIL